MAVGLDVLISFCFLSLFFLKIFAGVSFVLSYFFLFWHSDSCMYVYVCVCMYVCVCFGFCYFV